MSFCRLGREACVGEFGEAPYPNTEAISEKVLYAVEAVLRCASAPWAMTLGQMPR